MNRGTRNRFAGLGKTALVLAAGLGIASAATAAEQTINGFSVWEGNGTVFETGPGTATFLGSIDGILFIETEKGPAVAGRMVCPALLEIQLASAAQTGAGKCTITGDDGAKVYADWTCQGVHLVGCDGALTLTGGTGRMKGVTGTGSLSVRTVKRFASPASMAGDSVKEIGSGIMVIRELAYSLPEQ